LPIFKEKLRKRKIMLIVLDHSELVNAARGLTKTMMSMGLLRTEKDREVETIFVV
jgi:hypothetical protein